MQIIGWPLHVSKVRDFSQSVALPRARDKVLQYPELDLKEKITVTFVMGYCVIFGKKLLRLAVRDTNFNMYFIII